MSAILPIRPPSRSTLFPYTTLFRSFATQSVLAIQNARLFREIEDKGRQIEAANRQDRKSTRLNSSHGYTSYAALSSINRIAGAAFDTSGAVLPGATVTLAKQLAGGS